MKTKRITKGKRNIKKVQRYFSLEGTSEEISNICQTKGNRQILNDFYLHQFQHIEKDLKYQKFDELKMAKRSEFQTTNTAFLLSCLMGLKTFETLFYELKAESKTKTIDLTNIKYQEGVLKTQTSKKENVYVRIIMQTGLNTARVCPFIIFHIFSVTSQELYSKKMVGNTDEEEIGENKNENITSSQQIRSLNNYRYNKKQKTMDKDYKDCDEEDEDEEYLKKSIKIINQKVPRRTRSQNQQKQIPKQGDMELEEEELQYQNKKGVFQTRYQEEDEEETENDWNSSDQKQRSKQSQNVHQSRQSSDDIRNEQNVENIKVKVSQSQQPSQINQQQAEAAYEIYSRMKVEENENPQSLEKYYQRQLQIKDYRISQLELENHEHKEKINLLEKKILDLQKPKALKGFQSNPFDVSCDTV